MINGLIAFVCLLAAGFCFYRFQTGVGGTPYMIGGIVLAIAMAIFGVLFLSGRINKTEDIHITE